MTQGRVRTSSMMGCSTDDGVFYRCGCIIQAEHNKKRHEKCRGTLWREVVYSSEQVYIAGLVVLLDAALDFGHCRFYEFDLQLLPWRMRDANSLQARRQVGLVTSRAPPPAGAEALGNRSALMPPAHELNASIPF